MIKNIIIVVIIGFSFFSSHKGFAEPVQEAAEIVDVGNKLCPVMGAKVDAKYSYVYQGKQYGFCCAGCIGVFKQDPQKYIAILEENKQE